MTTVSLSPILNATQQFDNNGQPLAGGYIYFYQAGSYTVLQNIYSDSAGTVPLANPVILDSTGRVPTEVWIDTLLNYNVVLTKSDGTSIIKNWDNISSTAISGGTGVLSLTAGTGIALSSSTGDVTVSSYINEWMPGSAPAYVSTTSFTVPLDQVATYTVGRRVKATVTSGIVYGTVVSSTYTTLTTIVLTMDLGQSLDTGLSAVWYGFSENLALPTMKTQNIIAVSAAVTLVSAQSGGLFAVGDGAAAYNITLPAPFAGAYYTFQGTGVGTYLTGLVYTGSLIFPDGTTYAAGTYTGRNLALLGNTLRVVSNDGINWQITIINNLSNNFFGITSDVDGINNLNISFGPATLVFKNPTATSGAPISLTTDSLLSLVVPSGATLGTIANESARLYVVVAYNAGAPVLCVTNSSGGVNLSETGYISPTTISTGATLSTVIYSASAVAANSPYRVVGFVDITEVTPGTWATSPTNVQGYGGQALNAMSSLGYGQTWKAVTRTLGVTYYNTTGKPIFQNLSAIQAPANEQYIYVSINGGSNILINHFSLGGSNPSSGSCSIIIPPGVSYRYSLSSGTFLPCTELS